MHIYNVYIRYYVQGIITWIDNKYMHIYNVYIRYYVQSIMKYVSYGIFNNFCIAINGPISLGRDKWQRMHYKKKLFLHTVAHLNRVVPMAYEVTAKDSSRFLKSKS